MPSEDSADHEFVFLVHKSNPPAPSSSVTSLSSSSVSSASSSGSSSTATTCRLPRFPHLRPIPIELQESDHDEDRGSPRGPFPSVAGSPPRSPPPVSTCSSRMSPLPMELLELMPARLRMQGYISGRTAVADDPPPSRPPPPTNYAPADYCYVGVDSCSGDVKLESDGNPTAVDHNYDYLRELVTSDAVAVLANSSSPITSLARSAVRARAASPSQRSSTGDVVGGVKLPPKFAKPDIITSNLASSRSHYQLPSPKFTRTPSESLSHSSSFQQASAPLYHHSANAQPSHISREPSGSESFLETQSMSSDTLNDCKSSSFTSSTSSDPRTNVSSSTGVSYRAVLTHDGGNNPVLRKLGEQPAPFLASFRSAAGTNATGSAMSSRNESPSSYSGSPSSRIYGNSPASSHNNTPNTSNKTTPVNSHNSTPVPKRAPIAHTKPGSPTPEAPKRSSIDGRLTTEMLRETIITPEAPKRSSIDGRLTTEMLRETIIADQSNYVVGRSHLKNRLPSPPSYKSPVVFRNDRTTTELSFSDGSAPLVPPRRGAVSDGFSSESSSSYSRSSLGGHRHTHVSGTRPAQGITKLAYPLSDKYTNVLNANMSSGKWPSSEISVLPPPMEKIRFDRPLGMFSMQTDRSISSSSEPPGEVSVQQREAAANIQDKLFSKPNQFTRQAGMSPVLHRRPPQQSPEFFQFPPHTSSSSASPPPPAHHSIGSSSKFTPPPSYPQAGCHPVPIVESPTEAGPLFPCGPTQNRPSTVSSPHVFNSTSIDKSPCTSPVLSRVPYQGQHRVIQPLPAPPPILPWSKGSTPPRVYSYDPDGIYDNLIVTKSKSVSKSGEGGHYKSPISATNSSISRHLAPVSSQWSPSAPRRSVSPPNSGWPIMQVHKPSLQHMEQQQHQHQQSQHERQQLLQQSYQQHHQQHQSQPLNDDNLLFRRINQQSPYQCQSQPDPLPSHQSALHYSDNNCQHQQHQQKPVQYWSNVDACPTCQQPPPLFQNALYRSSSCERFAPPPTSSPSSSPQLSRRGGSASPSLRHSPSPDPGGSGGLGKPPRPRRQQYRRVAYSPQQPPALLCSTPGCTIPHIHQPQGPSQASTSSGAGHQVYPQSNASRNLTDGNSSTHQRSPHLCYQETHLSHLSAHAPSCLAASAHHGGHAAQMCHHFLSCSNAAASEMRHVSSTATSSLQQCNVAQHQPLQYPSVGLHTFKNVSAMNSCTVLTSSKGGSGEPCCQESRVAAEGEAAVSEDLGNKLKGGPGHKSLYRCVRSLLMPNQ